MKKHLKKATLVVVALSIPNRAIPANTSWPTEAIVTKYCRTRSRGGTAYQYMCAVIGKGRRDGGSEDSDTTDHRRTGSRLGHTHLHQAYHPLVLYCNDAGGLLFATTRATLCSFPLLYLLRSQSPTARHPLYPSMFLPVPGRSRHQFQMHLQPLPESRRTADCRREPGSVA
jgi:hypothetical protein